MEESYAGRGAEARAKAERLLAFADNCDKGDEGERETARLMMSLPNSWTVLHNVFLPGRRFNVDHLLIGPGGVIALDSKNYSGPVKLSNGTMWCGRYPKTHELQAAQYHADCIAELLGVGVNAALCIHTAELPAEQFSVGEVDVLSPARLAEWLCGLPPELLDMQVTAVSAAAGPLDDESTDSPTPSPCIAAPGQLPPMPPTPASKWPPPPDPRPPRPAQPRRRTKQNARSRRIEKLVVEGLTGLAVFGLASWYIPRMGHSIKSMTPPTTTAPAQAPGSPPVLHPGTFSCPVRGRGWTLQIPLPEGQPATAAYQTQWSTAPDGPWNGPLNWRAGSPLSIAGLQSASRVFVRAYPAGASADTSSMEMEKTPTQSC